LRRGRVVVLVPLLALFAACSCGPRLAFADAEKSDPLPSWNAGPSKQAIVDFVTRVTTQGGTDFVAPADRIAVFDNDGSLWCEQPMYVQLAFALDRIKALASEHPEWQQRQPFKAALEGDLKSLAESGERGLTELVMASHAGMTNDQFAAIVRQWISQARHPKFARPYTQCIYQPMLELLGYLRAHGFKTFIVSGGGIEFMRVFAEETYGIPPEQVIGSGIKLRYEEHDGEPALVRLPEIDFVDDKAGKPVAIGARIGRRPLMAFGNSDGDYEMLRWTTSAPGPRFGLIVHHTDPDREYAYDRKSLFGKLDRALAEAQQRGWIVVDMKRDWQKVFTAK
jgi:phosphoserine phosphatase